MSNSTTESKTGHEDCRHDHATLQDHGSHVTATDPVCGMVVDLSAGKPSLVYKGTDYHFCSQKCHDKFESDPWFYVSGNAGKVEKKAASGALDLIDLIEVRNLAEALEQLNAGGFLTVGLDSEGDHPIEAELASAEKIALVLGAEGKGLRQRTRETCARLARLDMPGTIKSLNVSNAAALSLYVASRALSADANPN